MQDERTFENPIIPGFHPDPSICRVDGDFYLVNSSFAYFPGIPIRHSRDLAHWEQIGHVLSRPSQLPLAGAGHSRGIFAPTIRHHRGVFYVVCTNVDHGGNFVVTATDPAGPWSEPAWLPDAPGIDPSLFFDDDGRAWYCGTRPAPEGEAYPGNWEIWLREFDPSTLSLKGPSRGLWRGALRDCVWPEGPHIYRRGQWYYLMIAEGGTGPGHAVTVARSRTLAGPWEGNPSNPILTHRQLGKGYPIVNVGHGDLIDDPSGDWWMVHLASRPYGGLFHNLGRETFLVPVAWEDDWPLPCPGRGRVEERYPSPRLEPFSPMAVPACDQFDDLALAPHWISLRGPAESFSSLSERPGWLRLRLRAPTTRDADTVSFLGRRQLHMDWSARARIDFSPREAGEAAGLVLLQSDEYQYRLEIRLSDDARPVVRLVAASGGEDIVMAERPCDARTAVLAVEARSQDLSFRFGSGTGDMELLASGIDGRILSTERAGGFVGTVLGMFATAGGRESDNVADFDWFEYRSLRERNTSPGRPGTSAIG